MDGREEFFNGQDSLTLLKMYLDRRRVQQRERKKGIKKKREEEKKKITNSDVDRSLD